MQLIYKPAGLTINQFIKILQEKFPHDKLAYAGRLDPMARGLIPILFNEECLNMGYFTAMTKVYQCMVMIGIQTDSDDALGLITSLEIINTATLDEIKSLNLPTEDLTKINIPSNKEELDTFINSHKNHFELNNLTLNQKFHYYSTKAINKRKKKDYSESFHQVKINSSRIIGSGIISYKEFRKNIIDTIDKVDKEKDFRQNQIKMQWGTLHLNRISYIHLELDVNSGFFVRQFVRDLSKMLNIPLMVHDIHRIDIRF